MYLIDEVHMLSTHSFNALLKQRLEEPPHVKFLARDDGPAEVARHRAVALSAVQSEAHALLGRSLNI